MDCYAELKKLLALEYNCSESDIDGSENIVTCSAGRGGRHYSDDADFFSMATTGTNCLITADERMLPFLREFARDGAGHWLFEESRLAALERELGRFGYRLFEFGSHHMYLPRFEAEFPRKYPIKRLETLSDIEPFYGDSRFPNALCEKYLPERPDVLALAALDGDAIMGMAGASLDYNGAPGWLQIGIDVLPEYRGHGVGAFLVNELKCEMERRGDIPFYGTSPANIHSQNVAINCGFRPAWVEISAQTISS